MTSSEHPTAGGRPLAVTVLPGVPLYAPQPGQPPAQDQAPAVQSPLDPRGHTQAADLPGRGLPAPPPQAVPWPHTDPIPPPGPSPQAALLSPDPALASPRAPLSFDKTTPLPPAVAPAYEAAPPSTIERPQLSAPAPTAEPLTSAPVPAGIWDAPNAARRAPAGAVPALPAGGPPAPASVDTDESAPRRSRRRGRHAARRASVRGAAQNASAIPDEQGPTGAKAPKRTSAKRLLAIAMGAAVLAVGYVAYTAFFGPGDDEVVPAPPVNTATDSTATDSTATDSLPHLSTGPSTSPSPSGSAAPSAVKTTAPVSPVGRITLPQRIGELKRQTGAVAATREAAMLKGVRRGMPKARNAVLGLYGDSPAPAVVLVYRAGKGAPIPAPNNATGYPAGRQGGVVACGQVSSGAGSQCTWVDSRTVGTLLLPRATQPQALDLLRKLRNSLER